ncbi:DUF4097 family beta strand repeat-containing protein [Paenibacillus silviterrae]|uniref:DUF4097 family beta strand repeat-containing protein n=1 Tax=Paenibacillus silviterrae TaxID=3242194 RepID=UPI0025430B6B|nr:DUF4097 family beta strand repeat-containing protein [Paenibacillus chinjuensis]
MHRAGRYTAALLLIAVGGAVIADKLSGTKLTALLIEWWPLLFISLGLEYLFYNMKYKESEKALKLDLGGVIFAVVISAAVLVATQSESVFKNFTLDNPFGAFGEGQRFEKGMTAIPLAAGVDQVRIDNTNGTVTMQSGNVDQVQVELIVYVNLNDEVEAARVAEESRIEHTSSGNKLTLTAAGKEYSGSFVGRQKPRMDMVVTLPEKQKVDVDLQLTNGKIIAGRLPIKQQFTAQSTNGELLVTDLEGNLSLKTTNGSIMTKNTAGASSVLQSTNGKVEVQGHKGDAKVKTTNGRVVVKDVTGSIEASTNNGSVEVDGAPKALKAKSTNGSVEISSRTVGGDWDVETSHGKVELELPSKGDYQLKGEGGGGNVKSELPLSVHEKTVSGSIGSGQYKIRVETNGSIAIKSVD